MDLDFIDQIIIFWILVACTLVIFKIRKKNLVSGKSTINWAIDLLSLLVQGILIPLIQVHLLASILKYLFPHYEGSLVLGTIATFILNFAFVDYTYYLVHKFLHKRRYWPLHFLHHTAEQMDVFVSSRNNFWASFLFPYLWLNGLFLFLVEDKKIYLFSVGLTAMLDLWRHSELVPKIKGNLLRVISAFLITPYEHAEHHSTTGSKSNYGANLCLWDRLHGTYKETKIFPNSLGYKIQGSFSSRYFFPYKSFKEQYES